MNKTLERIKKAKELPAEELEKAKYMFAYLELCASVESEIYLENLEIIFIAGLDRYADYRLPVSVADWCTNVIKNEKNADIRLKKLQVAVKYIFEKRNTYLKMEGNDEQ